MKTLLRRTSNCLLSVYTAAVALCLVAGPLMFARSAHPVSWLGITILALIILWWGLVVTAEMLCGPVDGLLNVQSRSLGRKGES